MMSNHTTAGMFPYIRILEEIIHLQHQHVIVFHVGEKVVPFAIKPYGKEGEINVDRG